MINDPEEEAWAEIQQVQSLNRKRQIEDQIKKLEQEMGVIKMRLNETLPKTPDEFYNELRNQVIQEVADWVHTMPGFGQDTLDSFHIRIMGMKQ